MNDDIPYVISSLSTGVAKVMCLPDILDIVNRGLSRHLDPYDAGNWREGLCAFTPWTVLGTICHASFDGRIPSGQLVWYEYRSITEDPGLKEMALLGRSHQRAKVIGAVSDGCSLDVGMSLQARYDTGDLAEYLVSFRDGYTSCVSEDELLDSPSSFIYPSPYGM